MILALGGGLFMVIAWFAICFFLGIPSYLLISGRYLLWRAFIPRYSSRVVSHNRSYSSNMMSISILSIIFVQSDKIILSKLVPIGILGYYSFVYLLVSRTSLIADAVAQATLPHFTALIKEEKRPDLMIQYRKLHDLVSLATVPLNVGIAFVALPLLTFIFNKDVAHTLLAASIFLCLGSYMHNTLLVPYYFSLADGRPDISVRANIMALVVILPTTFILIYFFGVTGAGLSWVFYHIFLYIYSIPRICLECLNIRPRTWFLHIGRIFVMVSLTYGIMWAVFDFLAPGSLFAWMAAYVMGSVAFIICAYKIMDPQLRLTLQQFVRAVSLSGPGGI